MCNYYNRFIRNYAKLAAPLTDLLCNERVWAWGAPQEAAFTALKAALSS